jgi:hypothetical protein
MKDRRKKGLKDRRLEEKSIGNLKEFSLLILCALVIFSITECSKKSERTHYTITDSIKPYCVFQQGSYWVYNLPYTKFTDTTIAYKPPDIYTENQNPNEELPLNDVISISFHSKIFREFYVDHEGLIVYDNYGGVEIPIITGFSVGQRFVTTSQEIYEYLEFLDTFSCNGNVFHNVIHTKFTHHTLPSETLKDEYYIGKGIGLIIYKKSFNGIDSIWSLTQYHINQ